MRSIRGCEPRGAGSSPAGPPNTEGASLRQAAGFPTPERSGSNPDAPADGRIARRDERSRDMREGPGSIPGASIEAE